MVEAVSSRDAEVTSTAWLKSTLATGMLALVVARLYDGWALWPLAGIVAVTTAGTWAQVIRGK